MARRAAPSTSQLLLQGAIPAQYAQFAAFESPSKSARTGTGPDADDAWTCPKCGNFNYGGRFTCNMRSCGTGKPIEAWTCPGCGNENNANRPFCNMRSCGMAKPGLRAQEMVGGAQIAAAAFGAAGAPPGSWTCAACGNVNWPQRSTCNGAKGTCGMPRTEAAGAATLGGGAGAGGAPPPGSWVCSACSNVNWPQRSTCNAKNCGRPRHEVDSGDAVGVATQASPMQAAAMHALQSAGMQRVTVGSLAQPAGSWVCAGCSNVNWPQRSTCNGSNGTCGLPRGGPYANVAVPSPTMSVAGSPPPGSWQCAVCSNVNWPQRTTCNGKSCGRARQEVDAGTPTPKQPEPNPEGSWVCGLCQNVNWPQRSTCNKRGCGAARGM